MASKIKVDQIQTADGTGTIALQNQLSGMTTASLPALGSAQMPTGSILQVVSSEFSTDTVTSNTSLTASGHTVVITPSSTSSKIYVMLTGSGGGVPANGYWIGALYRGSTNISTGMGYTQYLVSTVANTTYSYNVMDSPSTTSAITYQMYWRANHSSVSAYYRWSDKGNPLLTAIEIAG